MRISEASRRNIADAIAVERIILSGRLEEPEFLGRLFDVDAIPSTESGFEDAAEDIWQHRVNSRSDWNDD